MLGLGSKTSPPTPPFFITPPPFLSHVQLDVVRDPVLGGPPHRHDLDVAGGEKKGAVRGSIKTNQIIPSPFRQPPFPLSHPESKLELMKISDTGALPVDAVGDAEPVAHLKGRGGGGGGGVGLRSGRGSTMPPSFPPHLPPIPSTLTLSQREP
jgi:hypothetical protein